MKKIFFIFFLFTFTVWNNTSAAYGTDFVVEEFSSDTYTWVATNLRTSFVKSLHSQGRAIESIVGLPSNNDQRLQFLKAQGYKYLVRGKVLSAVISSDVIDIPNLKTLSMEKKTVYHCDLYYALSYISCETGLVYYSTIEHNQVKAKDSQEEAMKVASTIAYSLYLLPEEYHKSLGKIVSLGESSKKGAKTVFATISQGQLYSGKTYKVYEQIPSEEWGFEAGDMLLSKIGELKLKETRHEGESIELKVTKGEKEIKNVFDAGIHQIIIK